MKTATSTLARALLRGADGAMTLPQGEDPMSDQLSTALVRQAIAQLNHHSRLVLRGAAAARLAYEAIQTVSATRELLLTFDPDSAPELRDYLATAIAGGMEGAVAGGL